MICEDSNLKTPAIQLAVAGSSFRAAPNVSFCLSRFTSTANLTVAGRCSTNVSPAAAAAVFGSDKHDLARVAATDGHG